jgi:hypothetical protein
MGASRYCHVFHLHLHRNGVLLKAYEMIALAATTPQWRKHIASIIVQPPSDTIVEGDNEFEWQPASIVASVYRPTLGTTRRIKPFAFSTDYQIATHQP